MTIVKANDQKRKNRDHRTDQNWKRITTDDPMDAPAMCL